MRQPKHYLPTSFPTPFLNQHSNCVYYPGHKKLCYQSYIGQKVITYSELGNHYNVFCVNLTTKWFITYTALYKIHYTETGKYLIYQQLSLQGNKQILTVILLIHNIWCWFLQIQGSAIIIKSKYQNRNISTIYANWGTLYIAQDNLKNNQQSPKEMAGTQVKWLQTCNQICSQCLSE